MTTAGIANFRFHNLRHSAASYLAMQDATLLAIGAVLGHRTPWSPRRYAHLCEGHTDTLVQRMNASIFGQKTG